VSTPTGGYQGLGYYGGEEPPKKRNGLLIAIVVAAVVLLAMVATVLIVGVKNSTPGQALPVASVTTSKPTSKSGGPSQNPLQPKATGAPLVPGWKPVAINDGKDLNTTKAYDVPPSWEPLNSSISFGATTKTTLFIPTLYMKGYCTPTSFRSAAGLLLVSNIGEVPAQATKAAQVITDAVYVNSDGTKSKADLGQPQPVKIDGGSKNGYTVTAKVTVTPSQNEKDKCNPATAIVTVMLLEPKQGEDTSVVLTAFADQGFPEATSEEDLLKVVTSIHPAN
jgi:hypothetical protein